LAVSADTCAGGESRFEFSQQILAIPSSASSSHFDDAMIRRARMTIAQLMKRMDAGFKTFEQRMTSRFDAVDARFEAVDARFDAVDARSDAVDARFDALDARFDAVDKRFDAMAAASDARFGRVDRNIEAIGEKLDTITRTLHGRCDHQQKVANEHEDRLKDLERAMGR
jgi:chromosome segregation ATPase